MNACASPTRRCAKRLAAHAAVVLPRHRTDWARAMQMEVDHIQRDAAALRWAAGAVLASYLERIQLMRNFALSATLVLAGIIAIEGAHLLTQYLFQDRLIELLTASLPVSLLTSDGGTFAPLGMLLTAAISVPVAIVAWILGRTVLRLAPDRARAAIKATVVADAMVLAAAILISLAIVTSGDELTLDRYLATAASTSVLWAIRVLFVAVPLLALLCVHRPGRVLTTAESGP